MDKIKVFVVEDDQDWLDAIVAFLNNESDICVVSTSTNSEDAVKLVKDIEVDVVLMDINLSGNNYDGIYAAAEIGQICKAKIIMLTSLTEEDVIIDSFTAGAINYISKANYRDIPTAIRSAYHSHTPVETLLKEYLRLKEEEQIKELTSSEKEVFSYIEKGHTLSSIEKTLFKSKSTLKNQVNNILKKLGVKNSKEAVQQVKTRGILKKISKNDTDAT